MFVINIVGIVGGFGGMVGVIVTELPRHQLRETVPGSGSRLNMEGKEKWWLR